MKIFSYNTRPYARSGYLAILSKLTVIFLFDAPGGPGSSSSDTSMKYGIKCENGSSQSMIFNEGYGHEPPSNGESN